MKRKLSVLFTAALAMFLLAGCSTTNAAITADTASGFWERAFVLPLTQFITFLYGVLGHNLGFAIIAATVIVRLVLMPLFAYSNKSMAAMQEVQPEIQRIQKKYEGKKDPESQQRMMAETSAIYKKYKVSPASGCLPLLLQMPIFMAFFQAINRHPMIAVLRENPDATASSAYFFGLNLAATMSMPNYILGALVAGLTFVSQRLMTKNQNTSNQNKQMGTTMKAMNIYFPFMMFATVIAMPAAMGLYFLVGQIMQMIQTLVFRRPAAGPTF